ncbi:hypothetical protein [Streptomyces collinus]|uniref:hypothetical protein n=1 Tax=Streptomyces collinus TaxID=42684 RepID=UPI00340462AC
MTRRIRCFWDQEDIWFYVELDPQGYVVRQVELQEPGSMPLAAASLAEWQQAGRDGRLAEYEHLYGVTAQVPVCEWEGHAPEEVSAEEFELVWSAARRRLADRRRGCPS